MHFFQKFNDPVQIIQDNTRIFKWIYSSLQLIQSAVE